MIKEVKNTVPWTYTIGDLNREKNVGRSYENELQKTNQKEFRKSEKVIKRKGDKLYVKWKGYDNSFNSWIDKKGAIYLSEYFPKLNTLGANAKAELALSNYAIKTNLKNATGMIRHLLLKKLI